MAGVVAAAKYYIVGSNIVVPLEKYGGGHPAPIGASPT